MKRLAHATALATLIAVPLSAPAPVLAQDAEADGRSLMEEGSRMLLRGLLQELEPAIEELEGASEEMREAFEGLTSEMGPAIRDILRLVDQARYYEAPEVLENGDILIRRKPDAPPYEPSGETGAAEEEIDL